MKIKNQKGFTLLELIVAMAVFVMVILSATQIFKNIIDAQRSAASAQDIQESLRYAFETISKELRSAQKDDGTCIADGSVYEANVDRDILSYKNTSAECVSLYLDSGTLMISKDDSIDVLIASTTPSKVIVRNLEFRIGPATQPSVTIKMDIETEGKEEHKQSTTVQTTVSSRFY